MIKNINKTYIKNVVMSAFLMHMLIMSACTYSITMIHSEGSTDTLDEAQTASPTVSPNVNVPVSTGLPISNLLPTTHP